MGIREGERAGRRKEERERKNKALLSRAEVGCTSQDGHMAGSKQCQLLKEGISRGCAGHRKVLLFWDTVHLQTQQNMPSLHKRVH